MTTLNWKSTVVWSLLGLMFLLFALVMGPAPALAGGTVEPGAVLYEVTEDMYLLTANGVPTGDVSQAVRRTAVAQLSGSAKIGTPICPLAVLYLNPKAKSCTLNASGADDLSLATGQGTLGGTFSVVVQGDNAVDGAEFVIMTGTFKGNADLSLAMAGQAPLGFISNGVGTIDANGDGAQETTFKFSGTFRLPFSLNTKGKHDKPRRNVWAYYLDDAGRPDRVKANELSLGFPTVRLEINF